MDKETYENIIIVSSKTGLLFLLGGLIISLLLAARNRQLRHNAIIAETKNNFDKELINTRLEVTENILNEVARDLHDDVGQMLTFAILQLNILKSQNVNDMQLCYSSSDFHHVFLSGTMLTLINQCLRFLVKGTYQ